MNREVQGSRSVGQFPDHNIFETVGMVRLYVVPEFTLRKKRTAGMICGAKFMLCHVSVFQLYLFIMLAPLNPCLSV